MRQVRHSVLVSFVLLMGACQSLPGQYDQPARIVDPTPASREALQDAVNRAVGVDVALAENALTDRSILVIERSPPPTMENPVPAGRTMERPIRFRLVLNEGDCILIDERNQARFLLQNTTCVTD